MEKLENKFADPRILVELANTKMPFGKYQGTKICYLPEPYLTWFNRNGFPKGRIGLLLSSMYELKLNGLEHLLVPLMKR